MSASSFLIIRASSFQTGRSYDEKVAETPQISKWKCWHARAIFRPELMNPIKGERLLTQLNWHYAVNQFDPTPKISPEDWATLERALILSPSSCGLQPLTFIVTTDRKMREGFFPRHGNSALFTRRCDSHCVN